ncbi:hypothetical protein A2V68_01365 [candidate division Kazan bacterium RBG_13_50_9]|uniref:Uncharacterized protein n=1 Tax=candidate division Kazan bacterium RBG_13_50_9 TaxID=1798535 RepID=A0A1F4NSE5_UNCK3|nr:MAG: hypothetical protein A2V68_01365 [candidate division Kazan bacterium RBG_13_50_9]
MTDEKWGEIVDKVLADFEILEHSHDRDDAAKIETLVFRGPAGKVKLVRTVRPAVIDKKIIGAYRRGKSKAQFEYVYSDTDTVGKLEAYREVGGEWEKIDPDTFTQ